MHRLYDAIHRRNSYLGPQKTYVGKINDHEACSFQPCKRRALFNHARGEHVYLCLSTERQIGQGSTTMTRRWLTLRSHQWFIAQNESRLTNLSPICVCSRNTKICWGLAHEDKTLVHIAWHELWWENLFATHTQINTVVIITICVCHVVAATPYI